MTVMRCGVRAGAAAFAVGLALAGPQAAGLAAADESKPDTAAVSASPGDARGGVTRANRSAGEPRPDHVAQQRDTGTRPQGAASARTPRAAASAVSARPGDARGGAARGTRSPRASAAVPVDGPHTETPVAQPVTAAASLPKTSLRRAAGGRAPVEAAAQSIGSAAQPSVSALPASLVAMAVTPAVPASVDQMVSSVRDTIGIAQTSFFNTLSNLLIDLPVNDVTTFLEGALLLVRKRLFNQAPKLIQATSYVAADGNIKGRIGAIDLEGDVLTYSVVAAPVFGTVEVGADGLYVYTPGPDYAGSDIFRVEVASRELALNLLAPFIDNSSRIVTVQVGTPPPTAPLAGSAGQAEQFHDDVVVYLPDVSGRITVGRSGILPGYTGTVTLTGAAPDTQLLWMDSTGDRGEVGLDEVAQLWPEFQARAMLSGGGVDLGVLFTDDDGDASALLLSDVSMSTNADGQYVFTGRLSPNTQERQDSADRWDVIGLENQAHYDHFLTTHGFIDGFAGPTKVEFDFVNAAMLADTASPTSYQQSGLYAFDNQQAPTSGPPALLASAPTAAPVPESATSPVTASIPLGQSFVIGRRDGSVELWTGGTKQLLQAPIATEATVIDMLAYDRPLQDAAGNQIAGSFTGSIDGNVLTVTALGAGSTVVVGQEITGAGVAPGTTITKFVVPENGRCIEKNSSGDCTKSTGGQGGEDGGLGNYEVSKAQTVSATVITQPATLAKAPGFIVGLSDGTVRLWSATNGWVELQNSLWGTGTPRTIKAMATFGEGVAVGLDDGSLRVWSGPAGRAADAWKDNWITLRDCQGTTGCGPVEGIVAVRDGIVVANGPAVPENSVPRLLLFTSSAPGLPVFLNGAPAGQMVTAMTAFADGVAVGYGNGALAYWDLRASGLYDPFRSAVMLDDGSGRPVNALVPYARVPGSTDLRLIAGYGGDGITNIGRAAGAVKMFNGYTSPYPSVIPLHDEGWGSAVTFMTTFSSAAIGNKSGVIVGLDNGSVQLWDGRVGNINLNGQNYWTELHDPGWQSRVATLIPFSQNLPDAQGNVVPRDGVVVGLANGSVQQWSGVISGPTGQADWTQIVCGPQGCVGPPPKPDPTPSLDKDGTLKAAVDFAKGITTADWGKANNIGGAGDPLFWGSNLLPPCSKDNSCNGQFMPISVLVEKSPLEKKWTALDASVTLRYDVNAIAYGYAFMPDGFWNKLRPGKWSLAALAAVETGPALTVGLGKDGTINVPRTNLLQWDFSTPGPLGVDTVALGLGVDGEVKAQLACGVSVCPDKLNAHAYLVPGMLVTYNTQAKPGGVGIGFNWYPDLDYADFAKVTGASVTATVTPYATLSYGIFTPDSWWLVGGWSLFKLGVGYENPLSATFAAGQTSGQSGGASLTLGAQGFITTHAGLLEALTSKLSWDNQLQVLDVTKTYTLV